ncbi:MAG: polysaccharide pyruvyl transferase family protein [Pseudomonadota bacterium]|nr:polysaccharide pyruvyl transferase family protein [Pseudomonadota bacterium]
MKLVKRFVELLYLKSYVLFGFLFKFLLKKYDQNRQVFFIIPPAEPGSFGDAAMMSVVVSHYQHSGRKVYVLAESKDWKAEMARLDVDVDVVVVPRLYMAPIGFIALLSALKKYKPSGLAIIGADVLDGYYSEWRSLSRIACADLASRYCNDVRILGFSFNASAKKSCADYLKRVSHHGVVCLSRDVASHDRMLNAGIVSTPAMDLAFLLLPETLDTVDLEGEYVCINTCFLHYSEYGDFFIDKMVKFINEIGHLEKSRFLFIPHDIRSDASGMSDSLLMEKVVAKLAPELRERSEILPDTLNVAQVKYIVSKSKYCIVGRKHMGVGALSMSVPTMFIEYQDKQRGLIKLVGLNPDVNVVNPNDDDAVWRDKYSRFLQTLDDQRTILGKRIPSVVDCALLNFR